MNKKSRKKSQFKSKIGLNKYMKYREIYQNK